MGTISDGFNQAFRNFNTDGVPASGAYEPDKALIRSLGVLIDSGLASIANGIAIGGGVAYQTRAGLFADLAHDAGTMGFVWGDSTAAYNGVYAKSGASGTGSWTLTSVSLPSTIAADVTKALTLANAAPTYRGWTDSSDLNLNNFNSLTSVGWYWNERACFNTPLGTNAYVSAVLYQKVGKDIAVQIAFKDGKREEIWSRYRTISTDTWTAWVQETSPTLKIPASRLADNFPYRLDIQAGIPVITDRDFNKLLLPGSYSARAVAALNGPSGAGAAVYTGTLVVSLLDTAGVQTFYVSDNPNDVWTRTFTPATAPSAFSAWRHSVNRRASKKALILGDSIAAGGSGGATVSFAVLAMQYLGLQYGTFAAGGAAMAYRASQTSGVNETSFALKTDAGATTGYDIIFAAYGTNDYGTNVPLGTLGVSDQATFYGAMELGYANILADSPAARLIFSLPIYRTNEGNANSLGLTLQDYRAAIIAFCQSKKIGYIDPTNIGFNPTTAATFLADGLHPTDAGRDVFAAFAAGALGAIT
jgi:lysophospholipase L1-like esterase